MMVQNIREGRILILDFGSQYTQLIARRVREAGVYCEIYSCYVTEEEIRQYSPRGIILSGGPETVMAQDAPNAPSAIFTMGIPILGICYGMQTMVQQLGGVVHPAKVHEFGHTRVYKQSSSVLLDHLFNDKECDGRHFMDVWMSHGDKVQTLPEGFSVIATTDSCPVAAIAHHERNFYGTQFHPEVTHTKQGLDILKRFLFTVAACPSNWTSDRIIEDAIVKIQQQVGTRKVLLGLSGGVDSTVVAALLHRAIGDQLTCVFVDNGLLRLQEADQVMNMFKHESMHIVCVKAEHEFLSVLEGISDPEKKRKIIGETFIRVFEREAKKLGQNALLAQGTIYPDVIESAKGKYGKAHVIKSHHNVGGLPEDMSFEIVEPLRELFKDEVRNIGVRLGVPHDRIYRHPFPGPGLGVRILGEVKKEYADILRRADDIFINVLHKHDLYHICSQAFVVFLPVKSVGVVGDSRRYGYVVSIRAVETIDFMTAKWVHMPYTVLEEVSSRIINEISDIARVTYDISSKPPATIEWE